MLYDLWRSGTSKCCGAYREMGHEALYIMRLFNVLKGRTMHMTGSCFLRV